MTSTEEFGVLRNVDLRDVWEHEARDFTPWLADNLDRLSDVIGIRLDFVKQEVRIGQFSADIVAENPVDGGVVLIENQLEGSDHAHLGQILTYLGGLDAQTIIWIAREFAEPHLSAIRWLNDHTEAPYAYFAVQVKVLQIDDSRKVPQLDVLERPSDWDRTLRDTIANGGLTEIGRFRQEFWAAYRASHPDDGVADRHAGSNVRIPIVDAELTVSAYVAQGEVGVFLRGDLREPADAVEERIARYAQALTDELGAGGIYDGIYREWRTVRGNSRDQSNWPAMMDWLHDTISVYRRILEGGPPIGA